MSFVNNRFMKEGSRRGLGGIFNSNFKVVYPLLPCQSETRPHPEDVLSRKSECVDATNTCSNISTHLLCQKTEKRKTEQESNSSANGRKKSRAQKYDSPEGNVEQEVTAATTSKRKVKRNIVSILDEVFDESD